MDIMELIKEAPYIGALILVVVIFTRSIQETNKINIDSNEKRDTQWRQFLTEQRQQTTDALARMSAEITAVFNEVSRMNAAHQSHDAWTRESADNVRRALEKNVRKGNGTP